MRYLIILLALCSVASARLGETREELVARYGAVRQETNHATIIQGRTQIMGPSFQFSKDEWLVRCDMIDGRCVRISYARKGGWSQEQIEATLNENSQGIVWMEGVKLGKRSREWDRADGVKAHWESSGSRMDFTSPEYVKAQRKLEMELKQKAQEKPKP